MAPYPAKISPALQRFGAATVAIGFAAAVVASRVMPRGHGTSSLDQTRRMLHHVRDEVRAATAVAPNPALQRNLRKTEAALAEIARITSVSDWRALRALDVICQSGQTAMVFLSTGYAFSSGSNDGSITIEVTGNDGMQQFTFASGTTQANIITAVNSFRETMGVSATASVIAPLRVEFRSLDVGPTQFVRIKELNGLTNDFIFPSALATTALDSYKDVGQYLITLSPFRP